MGGTRSIALLLGISLALLACGSGDGASGGGATELTVFAAASLSDAMTRIGSDFEAAHPGTNVTFNFGASNDLASAIESEGTADVFASASDTYMDDVSDRVGVERRVDFAQNQLVVITPPDNPAGITSLDDLAAPGVQVVLAAEGVPVGDYARQSLENAGIEDAVLSNVVSDEEDDSSVVAKIIAGEADAAIVYTSDVTSGVAPQVGSVAIPDDVNVVATYPIAVMSTTLHADLARAFVEYVSGSEGEATLADLGFLPAPAS